MKTTLPTLLIIGTLSSAAVAQTNTPPVSNLSSNAPSTSLKISTQSDEERIKFLVEVAQLYFEEKDYESAADAYERVLKIDPNHAQARYVVAHVYISAKQYRRAETLIKELIKENPDDFKLRNNLAWLYATAEDPSFRSGEKAITLAQEAMVMAPEDHHVWSTLAEAYYVSGEYEKAYRSIKHMASLATTKGAGVTKEQVEEYNNQIRKCKRAWDTQRIMRGEDIEEDEE